MDFKKITRYIRKYFKLNYNENKAYQNLWDIARAVLRGKCIAFKGLDKEKDKYLNQ